MTAWVRAVQKVKELEAEVERLLADVKILDGVIIKLGDSGDKFMEQRDALANAPVGNWLLNWFGENAPAHPSGGYTFAQIADCSNYVGKHLKALAALDKGDG